MNRNHLTDTRDRLRLVPALDVILALAFIAVAVGLLGNWILAAIVGVVAVLVAMRAERLNWGQP